MKTRRFNPQEVIFSPTTECNLRCAHCDIEQRKTALPQKAALKFLGRLAGAGIKRVGFTGGEPFLALGFLCAITKEAVRRGMLFGRIMTNAGWFKTEKELNLALQRLFRSGYDGDFCVSVDAFHHQALRKAASFIKAAAAIWRRPDIVSIASVKGARESITHRRLLTLATLLNSRLSGFKRRHTYIIMEPTRAKARGSLDGILSGHSSSTSPFPHNNLFSSGIPTEPKGEGRERARICGRECIKSADLFIKVLPIDLSAVGKAACLKNPWEGKWFRDDFCRGPGNVFFILPDGTVKPCCGYATDADMLTIGSIKRDTPQKLLRNAANNPFVRAVFGLGLHPLRKRLEQAGARLPGKTTNHCFFCYYITHYLPRPLLSKCLR